MPSEKALRLNVQIDKAIFHRLEIIAAQREQIVEAFFAQHGCRPDEAEAVVEERGDGTTVFYVRMKTPPEETRTPASQTADADPAGLKS